jgi:hypothetical protein
LGIGDWGLGIGDWAQSPIPNPQSPIPNPQSPSLLKKIFNSLIFNKNKWKIKKIYLFIHYSLKKIINNIN